MSVFPSQETTLLPDIEAELEAQKTEPVASLRERWKRFFDTEPPSAFGPDLLRRSIAQKLQERAYGGLRRDVQRMLDKLVDAESKGAVAPPAPRKIRSGAVLQREWKGVSHVVMVSGGSYLYQGNSYTNLSQIARLITGTRWNGPRFFGLRATSETGISKHQSSMSKRKASPPGTSNRAAGDAAVPA